MTRDWEGNDEATDSASSAEKAGFETGVGMSYCHEGSRRGRDGDAKLDDGVIKL